MKSEEGEKTHERIKMKSCRDAVQVSKGIAINEGSSSSKRTRGGAKEKMRVDEIQKNAGRKQKMADHFSTLRLMIPHLQEKKQGTKERIVDQTISYIRKLERDLQDLQERKADAESINLQTHHESSIEVTVSGNVALFGIRAKIKRPTATMERVFMVFEEHKVELLAASVAVEDQTMTLTITALLKGDKDDQVNAERIKKTYPRS